MRGVGVEMWMCFETLCLAKCFETLCLAVLLVAYGGPCH
jgi:hypothetical protein